LDYEATENTAAHKREDESAKMLCGSEIEGCECLCEQRRIAGQMGNCLMLEAKQAYNIHHASDECQNPGTSPHPAGQL
jgi:hypothetical protein